MNIEPSAEFLAACRLVLGADDPATVMTVLQSRDRRLIDRLRAARADTIEVGKFSAPG